MKEKQPAFYCPGHSKTHTHTHKHKITTSILPNAGFGLWNLSSPNSLWLTVLGLVVVYFVCLFVRWKIGK